MRVNTEFKEVKGIGKIPVDWESKELDELILECRSGLSRQIKSQDIGIPVMISGNIQNGKLDTSELKYWYRDDPQGSDVDNYLLKDKDILLCFINSLQQIGKLCVYKDIGREVIYTTNLFRIRNNDSVISEFLYYMLSSKYVQNEIINITKPAVNQASFTKGDFLKIKVPYMTLKEQEKIAQILSNVDMNIEKTEKAIAKYKQVKKGLMDDLLTGKVRIKDGKRFRETNFKDVKGVGKIPWDWEIKKIEDIVSEQVKDGTHHTPKYKEKGIPFLRVTDIQTNEINTKNIKYVSEFEHGELIKRVKPERGDILYSKNGTIGIAKLVDWNWEFSIFVSLALIKPERKIIEPEYLTQVLNSDLVKKQIKLRAKQGTVTNLHLEEIRELIIVVPELKEQHNISKILFNQDTIIFKEEKYLEKLKKLKSGLMEDLLTGKVRVNTN